MQTIKGRTETNEAIHVLKHLLSDHHIFVRCTRWSELLIDMSEVDKKILREEIFKWLKRRV